MSEMTGTVAGGRGWKLAVSAGLILALVAAFILARDRSVDAASPHAVDPDLTGAEVADELGIKGEANPKADISCQTNVVVHEGVRYCMDGATSDAAQRIVLGWQIVGYSATDARYDYASAMLDLNKALETTDAEDPAIFELQARVKELKAAVAAEDRTQE